MFALLSSEVSTSASPRIGCAALVVAHDAPDRQVCAGSALPISRSTPPTRSPSSMQRRRRFRFDRPSRRRGPGASPRPAVAGDDGASPIKASLDAGRLDVLQVNSFWIMPQTAAADFRPVLDAARTVAPAMFSSSSAIRISAGPRRGSPNAAPGGAARHRHRARVRAGADGRPGRADGRGQRFRDGLVVDALHLDPAAAARRILPPCRTDGSPSRSSACSRPIRPPTACGARPEKAGCIRATASCRLSRSSMPCRTACRGRGRLPGAPLAPSSSRRGSPPRRPGAS